MPWVSPSSKIKAIAALKSGSSSVKLIDHGVLKYRQQRMPVGKGLYYQKQRTNE